MRIVSLLFVLFVFSYTALFGQALFDTPDGVGIFQPNPDGALHIEATGQTGLILHQTLPTDYGFGILLKTDRSLTKAFAHFNNGTENFILWGNGVVNATKIYSKEIEVRADAMGIFWPDYVFADAFELRPIPELEKYVKANHHLPEFPAAEELERSGSYDLTATITALLSTIEQQTLYIIELNKRIAALEANQVTQK